MHYRILIVIVLCSSMMFSMVNAEAERLASPNADEYLRLITQVIPTAENLWAVKSVIQTEFFLRFANPLEASYTAIDEAVQALYPLSYTGQPQFARWYHWLLLNWIDEQRIDLDTTNQFAFGDYTVRVTPRDFNADGETEWLLDVQSHPFTQLVVIARSERGYRVVESPLPYFDSTRPDYRVVVSGFAEEQRFDDLNMDGIPEWIVAVGGTGANQMNAGELYVINWRDDELVKVAGDDGNPIIYYAPAVARAPLFPYGVSVHYEDTDGDGSREIVIEQEQRDNWGCEWILRRSFAWDGSAFSLNNNTRTESVVRGCAIRAAEERMWLGDYQAAIDHYERSLTLAAADDHGYFSTEELNRYATARLALAYILTGQSERAEDILADLPDQPDESPVLTTFISAVRGNTDDPAAACQAAYDVFNFECVPETDMCLSSPLNVIVGYTLENSGYSSGSPRLSFPSAEHAGCNPVLLASGMVMPPPTATIQPTLVPQLPPDYRSSPGEALSAALTAMEQGAFEAALRILEQGLQAERIEDDTRLALDYVRGLAQEFAGQPEQAMAQYRMLVQLSPDSVWGKLAALQIES